MFGDFLIKHSTSNEVRGLKDRRTGAPSTEEYTVVSAIDSVVTVSVIELTMLLILFSKNVLKLSAKCWLLSEEGYMFELGPFIRLLIVL